MSARSRLRSCTATVVAMLVALPSFAQRTQLERGMNLFSAEQDVEMGREAAVEAEKQLKLLNDARIEAYVNDVGKRVAAVSIAPKYPYQFKVIDSGEINAFALPGGFIYVNRGVLEAADDESELAGVLAHEVGHVAMRHGTNQLSKQMLVQMPVALVLGKVTKGQGGWKETLAQVGVGLGLSAVFLSYSRKAETQSDVLATQQLYDAGYDPDGMARFFAKLADKRKGEPSKVEKFFSSHPAPTDRGQRVAEEASRLGPPQAEPIRESPAFARMKDRLASLPPPAERPAAGAPTASGGAGNGRPSAAAPKVPVPGTRTVRYRGPDDRFRLVVPQDWRAQESQEQGGLAVSLAPEAAHDRDGGLSHGMIVRLIAGRPARSRAELDRALGQLVSGVAQGNPDLRETEGARRYVQFDGAEAIRTVLAGRSSGGYDEVVGIILRPLPAGDYGHAAVLTVVPARDLEAWRPAFDGALRSLRFAR